MATHCASVRSTRRVDQTRDPESIPIQKAIDFRALGSQGYEMCPNPRMDLRTSQLPRCRVQRWPVWPPPGVDHIATGREPDRRCSDVLPGHQAPGSTSTAVSLVASCMVSLAAPGAISLAASTPDR